MPKNHNTNALKAQVNIPKDVRYKTGMHKPYPLTRSEIREIASIEDIQELWGINDLDKMIELVKTSYAVRFRYIGKLHGPFCGDFYIIHFQNIDFEVPPVRLIRLDGELNFCKTDVDCPECDS